MQLRRLLDVTRAEIQALADARDISTLSMDDDDPAFLERMIARDRLTRANPEGAARALSPVELAYELRAIEAAERFYGGYCWPAWAALCRGEHARREAEAVEGRPIATDHTSTKD